ncbi:hypothetical protein CCACVL1_15036 [Corchorus capsularis]|uniref:Uncharacterized protein n=1 Tax=Corchorus capsularis TaxID=210143 RepID=A0A1R3I4B8_COCAP|nr:hypothetical protein CCACVL1_15036 [Corchorus capsularis]
MVLKHVIYIARERTNRGIAAD